MLKATGPWHWIKLLPVTLAVAWILASTIQPSHAEKTKCDQQINYTRLSLELRARSLLLKAYRGKPPRPGENSFSCLEALSKSPVFDAWGRLARCSSSAGTLSLLSSGPDQEFNSADDIEVNIRLDEVIQPVKALAKSQKDI